MGLDYWLKLTYKKLLPVCLKCALWSAVNLIVRQFRFRCDLFRIPAKNIYGVVSLEKYRKISVIEKEHDKIVVCWLPIWNIGHFCTVYHYAYQRYLERYSKRILYVIVPDTMKSAVGQEVPNQYLYNKFTEKMPSAIHPETSIVAYIRKHIQNIKLLDMEETDKFYFEATKRYFAGGWGELSIPFDQPSVVFSPEEEMNGKEKMKEMGVQDPFICIFARDSAYYDEKETDSNQLRNFDIEAFREVTENFSARYGMQTVRMGAKVNKSFSCPGCVDYANIGRTEFMDLYLFSRCEFYLGSTSGIYCIALLFAKPCVVVDISFILPIDEPTMPYHLLIYVKWYDEKQQRYLRLRELIELQLSLKMQNPNEHGLTAFMNYISTHDITVVRSSPKEILDVAEEMYSILHGTMTYTKEDDILQNKYRKIIHEMTKKHKRITGNFARVGAKWLRDNSWFLE